MPLQLLMGNQAIGIAAIAAGVNVACGYPGTPSTEIVETIAKFNPLALNGNRSIHVEWSTNEKAALEFAAGASWSGARVIMTCKQMGSNVASDPLMCIAYLGVRGGMVIVVADDPGPISSQTEQDTRQFAQFAHVPVLDPSSPEEAYAMTGIAFELSERHGVPVILRSTTRVNHGSATIMVPDELMTIPRHTIVGFDRDPRWVIFPSRSRQAHAHIEEKLRIIATENDTSEFNKLYVRKGVGDFLDSPPLYGIACSGVSRGYVREALDIFVSKAKKSNTYLPSIMMFEVGTPFPFPKNLSYSFLSSVENVLTIEELEPVVERELRTRLGYADFTFDHIPIIHGRLDGFLPVEGEYSTDRLLPILAKYLNQSEFATSDKDTLEAPPQDLIPKRPPVLCAGCPHRASFLAVKCAVGSRNAFYTGDIGCYTMGCNPPLKTTDTCLCMGAGITIAQGISTASDLVGDDKSLCIGFVGDSTFFASAMTGIANAVYNQHPITVCILDNSTTAMTGRQPHPGTGVTLMGTRHRGISIPDVCHALGCSSVETVDPLNFELAVAAVRRALDDEGVSVVVFRSPCVQLFSALPPITVDKKICVGCKLCITKTGCPALSMSVPVCRNNSKSKVSSSHIQIDTTLCYGCDLCIRFCPTHALHSPREKLSDAQRSALREDLKHA